jgi:hypothetical protein
MGSNKTLQRKAWAFVVLLLGTSVWIDWLADCRVEVMQVVRTPAGEMKISRCGGLLSTISFALLAVASHLQSFPSAQCD